MAKDDVPPSKDHGKSHADSSSPPSSDLSNPYYTHHSDHPGVVLVSKPLNGDNYAGWKRAMTLALNSKNKLGFIDGSIKAPSKEADPEGYATWSRCNDMVHSWIVNTLSSKIADNVIYYSTAHEVWEDLCERFSQSNAPRIFEIQRDIACLRQEQLSVSAYYTKLKGLWDELATYLDATYGAQADQQKLMQFLMGLNETYSATRGQILLMNPLPTVRRAYAAVTQEEKQRLISDSHPSTDSSSSAAMAVRNSKPNLTQSAARGGRFERSDRPNQRQDFRPNFRSDRAQEGRRFDGDRQRGSGRGRPQCSYCGDAGHWVQTCYQLIGYPPGHPKAKQNGSNSRGVPSANQVAQAFDKDEGGPVVSLSEAQFQQFLSVLNKQNEGSSSKVNAVAKPGSGYEEDDWFG